MFQRPCLSRTSISRAVTVSITSTRADSRSGTASPSWMSEIGRPTSVAMRLSSFSAIGVNRRIRRSGPRMTMGSWTLARRWTKSLLLWPSSTLRFWSSSLTVAQLLVAGLYFFLGSLDLLVDALQLLVGRLHFLVGGLQLLVGRLLLLDDGLQVFAGSGQFLEEPLRLTLLRLLLGRPAEAALAVLLGRLDPDGGWDFLEEDHEVGGTPGRGALNGNHVHAELAVAPVGPYPQAVLPDRGLLATRPVQGRPYPDQQTVPQHLEEVQARLAGRMGQVQAGVTAELEGLHVRRDPHAGGRVLGQEDPTGLPMHVRPHGDLGDRRRGPTGRHRITRDEAGSQAGRARPLDVHHVLGGLPLDMRPRR